MWLKWCFFGVNLMKYIKFGYGRPTLMVFVLNFQIRTKMVNSYLTLMNINIEYHLNTITHKAVWLRPISDMNCCKTVVNLPPWRTKIRWVTYRVNTGITWFELRSTSVLHNDRYYKQDNPTQKLMFFIRKQNFANHSILMPRIKAHI